MNYLRVLTGLLISFAVTGCVSIHEGLQVDRPGEIDQRQNAVLKCPIRLYPHRLLKAHGANGSKVVEEGGRTVNTQVEFDKYWMNLTLDPGQVQNNVTEQGTDKPMVDWGAQLVSFYPFRVDNTCRRFVALPMDTDCLSIFFNFSQYMTTTDCKPTVDYPVFVFIYPKTDLPVAFNWQDDADKDGFSNESEIKVGTDPVDANSHP